jgi:hypothetical protein
MAEQLILVPLDGSELSERAIPYAGLYAKTFGGRILLTTVWEGADQQLGTMLPDVAAELQKEGEVYYSKYLAETAQKYAADGVTIDATVLPGNPADAVLRRLEIRTPISLLSPHMAGQAWGAGGTGASRVKSHSRRPFHASLSGPRCCRSQRARSRSTACSCR